jgi:transposase, IS30 family
VLCCRHHSRQGRSSRRDGRGHIPARLSIHERAALVEQRRRLGDWEGDTVIGAGHQGALVTLVDRVSRYTLAAPVLRRTSDAVTEAMVALLRPWRQQCHTITLDNGKEFAQHQLLAARLKTHIYLADPYSSWQRGCNEHHNGLLRHYFPKQMSLKNTTAYEVAQATWQLNHRSRKCLGWRTPH